jgi:hypothetical protein
MMILLEEYYIATMSGAVNEGSKGDRLILFNPKTYKELIQNEERNIYGFTDILSGCYAYLSLHQLKSFRKLVLEEE